VPRRPIGADRERQTQIRSALTNHQLALDERVELCLYRGARAHMGVALNQSPRLDHVPDAVTCAIQGATDAVEAHDRVARDRPLVPNPERVVCVDGKEPAGSLIALPRPNLPAHRVRVAPHVLWRLISKREEIGEPRHDVP